VPTFFEVGRNAFPSRSSLIAKNLRDEARHHRRNRPRNCILRDAASERPEVLARDTKQIEEQNRVRQRVEAPYQRNAKSCFTWLYLIAHGFVRTMREISDFKD